MAGFAEAEGILIVQEFTEVETGKGADALIAALPSPRRSKLPASGSAP